MAERYLADFLDRSRVKARAILDSEGLRVHVENSGRTDSSLNALGYRTSDGQDVELRTNEELPASLPARSELVLRPAGWMTVASAAVKLRGEGKSIEGFWVRRLGMKQVAVAIEPEILAAINGSEDPPPPFMFA